MVVQWKDEKHAVGVPEVDSQHQQLFVITNQLWQAQDMPDSPDRKARMIAGLKRLYAYCHYHFNDEEQMLQSKGYVEVPGHREIHRAFTAQVKVHLLDTRDSPHPDLSGVLDSLVEWILSHIMGDDRQWAQALTAEGVLWDEAQESHDTSVVSAWTDKNLSLELGGIDDQHRELIGILQQANDLVLASPARRKMFLPPVIRKLFYYTQFHFSFEEELMSRQAWPGLSEHRKLHATFVSRILRFAEQYKLGHADLTEELVTFLKEWTIGHILQEDKKFKDSLLGKTL